MNNAAHSIQWCPEPQPSEKQLIPQAVQDIQLNSKMLAELYDKLDKMEQTIDNTFYKLKLSSK